MSWNIFKIAKEMSDDLKAQGQTIRWLVDKVDKLERRIKNLEATTFALNKYAAAPIRGEGEPVFTRKEVSAEEIAAKEKKRKYQREWYAKNKNVLRAKRAAYSKNYYKRNKEQSK